ncbi:hypothetical protein SAMN05880501_11872 [Ureibacillus xyleni]|uniref:Uncharacterized protein n=1 Tax=Ureibacillus xyleni TaxID=614648 RepID=A0A285TQB8_9BACL|nr:hypothetical protein SAMN05880501_11872 [Ureibacillus xyleni]
MGNYSNEKVWKDFILDSKEGDIHPIILESWKRCKNKNLDYTLIPPIDPSINIQRLIKRKSYFARLCIPI